MLIWFYLPNSMVKIQLPSDRSKYSICGLLCARMLSEFLSPPVMGVLSLMVVGCSGSRPSGTGFGWAVVLAFGCGGPPLVYVWKAADCRGSLSMQALERGKRLATGVIAFAALAVGLGLAVELDAPRPLVEFLSFSVGGIALGALLTTVGKLSLHTAVLASLLGAASTQCGLPMLTALPLVTLVGWARIRVKAHTHIQVLAGCVFGLAWAAIFMGVRG